MNWKDKDALSVSEAAEVFGVSKATVYQQIREGTFPVKVLRIGNRMIVPVAPLKSFLGIGEAA